MEETLSKIKRNQALIHLPESDEYGQNSWQHIETYSYSPEVIIIIMKKIKKHVLEALGKSNLVMYASIHLPIHATV